MDKCTNLYCKCNEPASEKICGMRLKPFYWVSFFIKKIFAGGERIPSIGFLFFLSLLLQKYLQNEREVQVSCCFFVFVFRIHLQEKGEPKYQVSFFING